MELHADFTRRAVVHAAKLAWVASPMAGVERRMLDRVGGEVARATSIVRYAPDSRFSPHVHDGGEEFLVLDGVFQDEHGDFPAGSYIRNPPQSRHTPGSKPGCTIFVKLWQFDPADRTHVRVDTNKLSYVSSAERADVEILPLFRDVREDVRLERWPAQSRIELSLPGGGEFLVLDGAFHEAGEAFETQSWLRLPVGAQLEATAGPRGCLVWVKTGHLAHPQAVPAAAMRR
jgi:quercetin dioxygenase-like cupin family protein